VSGDGGSGGERLLDDVPHLACSIDHSAEHGNDQACAAPRHCVQLAYGAGAELRAVERHLPTLSAAHPRLFANIRNHAGKLAHPPTAFPATCTAVIIAIVYLFILFNRIVLRSAKF
jgi:hypothetical protein